MQLQLTKEEVQEAVAQFVSQRIGKPITADDVSFTTHYEGQFEEQHEVFNGVSVKYPG